MQLGNLVHFQILLFIVGFITLAPVSRAYAQPSGMGSSDRKLADQFDADGDGILNSEERKAAFDHITEEASRRPARRRRGRNSEPGKPGPSVSKSDVESYPDATLYDTTVLRTLFLDFENDNWEKELAAFKPTDIEVLARLTVDGQEYPGIGVSFRGASSFFMIPEGLKRSLNLSIDFVDADQRLYGYKSLNLLNCNGDAAMMSSALYSSICGQRIPTPKVNFVKVVINGESWGIYVSSQQFNKVFANEHFSTNKGARWKVSGSPRGDGGLRYLGEELDPYRQRFEIKSRDQEKSWRDLIHLCQVLNETPDDELKEALEPILDIEGALWFLAVDIALVNSDGYWTRASDYNIYQDPDGMFHILPHDMNEAFKIGRGGGPGGPGGARNRRPPNSGSDSKDRAGKSEKGDKQNPRGSSGARGGPPRRGYGVDLDPLVGLDEERKPLRSRLLNIPEFQQRYLENVRTIAEMLKWENLGPGMEQMRELIEDEVEKDTRKLSSFEAFRNATSDRAPDENSTSIRAFAERRSRYLLNHEKIRALPNHR